MMYNRYEALNDTRSDTDFELPDFTPPFTSSPLGTRDRSVQGSIPPSPPQSPDTPSSPPKLNNWRTLVINVNSIVGKSAEFAHLLEYTNPDAIMLCETKLDSSIKSAEFIDNNAGYTIFRRDRNRRGGGVAIVVKSCYNPVEVHQDGINCEIIWAEIMLNNNRKAYVGSFYRPPNSTLSDIENLNESISRLKASGRNHLFLLGGDFNVGDI
jgi:exonuclease III